MMQIHKLPYENIGFFSRLFIDYVNQKKELEQFYDGYATPENFIAKANALKFPAEKRSVLHKALTDQYGSFALTTEVRGNLDALLQQNAYTITTGHQLNIFTGPLYFILKIITVIKAAQHINSIQKDRKFIPVYWMASEDHDAEEINHFYLFNKKHTWETDQKGPVGKFSTAGFEKIFEGIKDKLPLLEKAYLEQPTLAAATRYLVNELFGEYGLVIIDGDHPALKGQCKELFKDELLNNISYSKVRSVTDELTKSGYEGQVYPREINLFYMEKGLRERIIPETGAFKVNNTDLKFSRDEILELLEKQVEKISPNVVLRPVYQEMILPNVAYCGGPAELSYWLQLKRVFEHYQIEFPILLPRAFSLIIQKANYSKAQKLNLSLEELFHDEQKLKEKILSAISVNEFELSKEEKEIEAIFNDIKQKASAIDPTLEPTVLAEAQKVKKALEQIEKRLKKAEEQKHDTLLSQLTNLKSKLFPEGQLQERRDNFLNFYLTNPGLIKDLLALIDPFDFRFNILIENE